MKWSNMTANDLHGLVRKLSLEPPKTKKRSKHPKFWYYLDDKKALRITLPNIHGGSGSVSTGFITQVRNALKLRTRQFEELVECPLSADDFEKYIRSSLENRSER